LARHGAPERALAIATARALTTVSALATVGAMTTVGTVLGLMTPPAQAGINFENCVQGSDGSLTCDTVPTGNTYFDDKAAQYGLFQNASPGWNEFDPYQGLNQELGDGED
jgi:hypothetical protein